MAYQAIPAVTLTQPYSAAVTSPRLLIQHRQDSASDTSTSQPGPAPTVTSRDGGGGGGILTRSGILTGSVLCGPDGQVCTISEAATSQTGTSTTDGTASRATASSQTPSGSRTTTGSATRTTTSGPATATGNVGRREAGKGWKSLALFAGLAVLVLDLV
ncbi:hypothetical protein BP6252_05023 [Coleophoma cylindrospora]|uniref:Uncharacterized protein n=1 Tax=Coleophoma cylindrospora TaxID=1849047 RepID=A0A3D8RSP2_9HELO|nr:hypothetical protein BP6252_05023 [Coleophoma cylindrospora]